VGVRIPDDVTFTADVLLSACMRVVDSRAPGYLPYQVDLSDKHANDAPWMFEAGPGPVKVGRAETTLISFVFKRR